MMKKYFVLVLIVLLFIFCLMIKKGDIYNEVWVKDINGFDILMG